MKHTKTETKERTSRYNIEALARGLEVLELFSAENASLSLSEAVSLINLNKSTVFRILSTLENMGYLELDEDSRRYRPSLKVLHLGFTAIHSLEVHQIARPHLERLAEKFGETVTLGVLNDKHVVYVDRIRNRSIVGVSLKVGSRLSAHCSTIGKVLLADLTADELEIYFDGARLTRYTPRTLCTREELLAELVKVRNSGYAICDEELAAGLRAVGVPIYNHRQKAIAGINVTGSSTTLTNDRLENVIIPELVGTAAQISFALGYNREDMQQSWKTILKLP